MTSKLSGLIRPTYWVVLVNEKLDDSPQNWRVVSVSDGMQSELQVERAALASPSWPSTCTYRVVTRTKAQRRYRAAWEAWEARQGA